MDVSSVYFADQHAGFRADVKQFLAEKIAPSLAEWEGQCEIPRAAWRLLGSQGLLGLLYESGVGGGEKDLFYTIAFLEELGRTGHAGFRAAVSVHAYMATYYLAHFGGAELQRKYLRPAIEGEKVAALAITETLAGSDIAGLSTRANLVGDQWTLNGNKSYVTNGRTADFYIVAARTGLGGGNGRQGNTGISLLLVDRRSPGIDVRLQKTVGWRAGGASTVAFKDVVVPNEHVVGKVNFGFNALMRGFQLERLVAATLALGGADRCLEETATYLRARSAYQGKLAGLQAVRHKYADLSTSLSAVRQLVYHAAWMYQRDALSVTECSMAKLHATEVACRIADECLQFQGGHGYLEDCSTARFYRDARGGTIAGGASEVMRDIIASQVLGSA